MGYAKLDVCKVISCLVLKPPGPYPKSTSRTTPISPRTLLLPPMSLSSRPLSLLSPVSPVSPLSPLYCTPLPLPPPAVLCPQDTTGTNVPTGDCVNDAGFKGTVTATQNAPNFYEVDVDGGTEANVVGTISSIHAPGVIHMTSSAGAYSRTPSSPYTTSVAVDCPPGATGTVPGTSGTGGESGCTYGTVPGYSGTGVTATQVGPDYYTTDIEAVACPVSAQAISYTYLVTLL